MVRYTKNSNDTELPYNKQIEMLQKISEESF